MILTFFGFLSTSTFENERNCEGVIDTLNSTPPSIYNNLGAETNFAKNAVYVPIGCVMFVRDCGIIYSRYFFRYGGL